MRAFPVRARGVHPEENEAQFERRRQDFEGANPQAVKDRDRLRHLQHRYWDFDEEKQKQYEIKKPDGMEQDRIDRIVHAIRQANQGR